MFNLFNLSRRDPGEATIVRSLEGAHPIALHQQTGEIVVVFKEAVYAGHIEGGPLHRLSEESVRAMLVVCAAACDEDGPQTYQPRDRDGEEMPADLHLVIGTQLKRTLAQILAIRSRLNGN